MHHEACHELVTFYYPDQSMARSPEFYQWQQQNSAI
ncbi:hypothetical protein ACP70R_023357 [Stipagrostis hirtigluma subsp. patula]